MRAPIFFHQWANGRRKRNLIAYLKNREDAIVWSHEEKAEIVFRSAGTSGRMHTDY
jgi:hypothetical protein